MLTSAVSVIHDFLSFAGWIEDRGSSLYDAIKKGDEHKVAATLNWPLCPRYAEIPENDEILKRAVLFYPHIASQLFDFYKNEISDDIIIEIFHDVVKQKSIQGMVVLLQHCAPKTLSKLQQLVDVEEEVLAEIFCYAAAEGQSAIVSLLLGSFGEKIPPEVKWGAYRSAKQEKQAKTAKILEKEPDIFFMFGRKRVHFHPIVSVSESSGGMHARIDSYSKCKVRC